MSDERIEQIKQNIEDVYWPHVSEQNRFADVLDDAAWLLGELRDARAENERLRERPYLTGGNWVAGEIVDDLRAKLAAVRALADKFERWPSGPSYAVTARAIREALSSGAGESNA